MESRIIPPPAVADAANGTDHARLAGGFHFAAKEPDEGVESIALDIGIGAPDALDQCFAGQYAIRVAHQQFENRVFRAREVDFSAAAPHFPGAEMQRNAGVLKHDWLRNRSAAAERAHAGQQNLE